MPLQYTQTVSVSDDSTSFTLTDTTGNYNAVTNPGGWGVPNPIKEFSYPYLQVYNVCTGTYLTPLAPYLITQDTDPFIYPELGGDNYISYLAGDPPMNPDYNPTTFDLPTDYGIPKLEDGIYLFTMKIVEGEEESYSLVSTYTSYVGVINDIDCCLKKFANNVIDHKCFTKGMLEKWMEFMKYRNAFDYAISCGNYETACESVSMLKTLCEQSSCGCGC